MIILKGHPDPIHHADNFGDILNKLNDFYSQRAFETIDSVGNFNGHSLDGTTILNSMEGELNSKILEHTNSKKAVHGENKYDVALWNVDNFRTATMEESKGDRDDLFVTPKGVKSAISETPDFNPDLYLKNGMMAISCGPARLDIDSCWNRNVGEISAFDYKKSLVNKYFNGPGSVALHRDMTLIIPKITDPNMTDTTWLYRSDSLAEHPYVNFHTDSLCLNSVESKGFIADCVKRTPNGDYSTLNGITGLGLDDLQFTDTALIRPFQQLLLPRNNLHMGFGLYGNLTNYGVELYINRFTINNYYEDNDVFWSNAIIDGEYSVLGYYTGLDGILTKTNFNDVVAIPWEKYIGLGVGVSMTVALLTNGRDDTANVSVVWNNNGSDFVALIQGVINATNGTISKRLLVKLAFKATVSLVDKTKFTLTHLQQQSKATINKDLTHISGNVLFDEDVLSPFHPEANSGAFIGAGGHYAAHSTNNGYDLIAKYFKYDCSNLKDYINNYHNLPTITGTKTQHISRYTQGYLGTCISRFIPTAWAANSNVTKALVRALCADGKWGYKSKTWNTADIVEIGNIPGELVFKNPNVSETFTPNIDLPMGVSHHITATSFFIGGLVLVEENDYSGYKNVNISSTISLTNPISLSARSIAFLTAWVNGTLIPKWKALVPSTTKYAGHGTFRVCSATNNDSGAVVILFSDELCNLEIALCNYKIANGLLEVDFNNTIATTSGFKTAFSSNRPYPSTIIIEPNGEAYDPLPNLDFSIFTSGSGVSQTSYVTLTNVYGKYLSSIGFSVVGWDGVSVLYGNTCVVKPNAALTQPACIPVSEYGIERITQNEIPITIPVHGGFLWDWNGAKGPHDVAPYKYGYAPNNGGVNKLVTYFDNTDEYVCYIPKGTTCMLGGTTYCLEDDLRGVIPNVAMNIGVLGSKYSYLGIGPGTKGGMVYLKISSGKIEVLVSATLLEPNDYYALFAFCIIGANGELFVKIPRGEITISDKVMSYYRIGNAIPYARGFGNTPAPGDTPFFKAGDVL